MKTTFILIMALLLITHLALAQGTFVYDQQSSDESYLGSGVAHIQSTQPMGQSFTPALASVDFIRIYVGDSVNDGLGATLQINLRSNSITGYILSSTSPVTLPSQYIGPVNLLFQSTLALEPGVQYYFQPVITSGGPFSAAAYNTFGYAGGTAFANGVASPTFDLWFREGIVVPEPSAGVLILAGLAMARLSRRLSERVPK